MAAKKPKTSQVSPSKRNENSKMEQRITGPKPKPKTSTVSPKARGEDSKPKKKPKISEKLTIAKPKPKEKLEYKGDTKKKNFMAKQDGKYMALTAQRKNGRVQVRESTNPRAQAAARRGNAAIKRGK